MGKGRGWTDEEVELLLSGRHSTKELAKMLGRTAESIYGKKARITTVRERQRRSNVYKNGVCNMTCPDFCPYRDCKLTGAEILMLEAQERKDDVA